MTIYHNFFRDHLQLLLIGLLEAFYRLVVE